MVITRTDGKSFTYSWTFTVGEPEVHDFGQLHSHTQYSDGAGTFGGRPQPSRIRPKTTTYSLWPFTDHSNYFDTTSAPNPAEALYDMSKASEVPKTWEA